MWRRTHFSRFLVVGSLNTALDFILFFIFADLCGINPVLASIASSGVTMCMSFYLNHKFVFRSNKGRKQTIVQFVAATLFTVWGVQSLVIDLVVHGFGDSHAFAEHKWMLKLFAKLCGIAVSFVLNFVIYRYIFREKEQEAVKEALVA